MEKFYRQDNLSITVGPKPGKSLCLEICSSDPVNKPELLGNQREVLKDIAHWIQAKSMDSTAALHELVCSTSPFIQGQSEDWLLIEFWTKDTQKVRDICMLLAGKFDFKFENNV